MSNNLDGWEVASVRRVDPIELPIFTYGIVERDADGEPRVIVVMRNLEGIKVPDQEAARALFDAAR